MGRKTLKVVFLVLAAFQTESNLDAEIRFQTLWKGQGPVPLPTSLVCEKWFEKAGIMLGSNARCQYP